MADPSAGAGGATVAVDVGGTFTDVAVLTGDGAVSTAKVPTTPADPVVGFVDGVRQALARAELPGRAVTRVVHGTTLATNAILGRTGPALALVTTHGYRTLLALGRHARVEEERYDLLAAAPEPLVPLTRSFAVRERVAADGSVLVDLDEADVGAAADGIAATGAEAVAVCLLHSYANPAHERRVATILRDRLGDAVRVTCSHAVLPELREFDRMATTVVSAYVEPVMASYLDRVRHALHDLGVDAPLHVMDSAGGVMGTELAAARAVATIESGPAAGVLAAVRAAATAGARDLVAFDMGGTTAKAALVRDGRPTVRHDFVVGGRGSHGGRRAGSGTPVRVPTLDLAEVGAGGGSIAHVDAAGGLHVGPASAGAEPGPACYGRGGTAATVTDADLLLGLLDPDGHAGAALGLRVDLARAALERDVAGPLGLDVVAAAHAVHELANAGMAAAIHVVTVQRGVDPRGHVLVASGGAGPVHACRTAARTGIGRVLVPPHPGVGTAVGLLRTALATERSVTQLSPLATADPGALESTLRSLAAAAAGDLGVVAPDPGAPAVHRSVAARYVGQAHELDVELDPAPLDAAGLATLAERFRAAYRAAYGIDVDAPIEVVTLRCRVDVAVDAGPAVQGPAGTTTAGGPVRTRAVHLPGRDAPVDVPVVARGDVPTSPGIPGPLLVDEPGTTTVVPPGWTVHRDAGDALWLEAVDEPTATPTDAAVADPLATEVVGNAFVLAAEEASIVVVRAAWSAFVAEGSDASAAILDLDGRLVASSVATTLFHSASLRACLPAVLESYPAATMRPGDVYVLNDVYRGGIHANDLAVYRPVFHGDELVWFAATLIHVLDLGGASAAGVSALATDVFHEGLQLPAIRLGTAAGLDDALVRLLAANSRLPDATLGDLRALVAGTHVLERRLQALAAEHGPGALRRHAAARMAATERRMRTAIRALPDGRYTAEQVLDGDGIRPGVHRVAVAVTIAGEHAHIDFTGTDPQVPASINSGLSQTTSAALFAFRCSLDPTIPMDEGCFAAITVEAPAGCLLHVTPPYPGGGRFLANFAAVDAIFAAMSAAHPGRAIAGSGILQPFALSGRRADGRPWIHTAYELGGMGARAGQDGVDAIGVHHGGGRNAVPQSEPLETQFPFLVETVELIPGSGGAGRWRGGLGTRTTFLLHTDALVNMRCDRFDHPPAGRDGGGRGRPGGYLRIAPDGTVTRLPDKGANVALAAGDRFVVETSGGGGLGDPTERDPDAIARDVAEGRAAPG